MELVKVTGKVTLDGQPPPSAGTLYFTPYETQGAQSLRPGRAEFNADGNFSAGAFDDGGGLVPGKYRVAVQCWKVAPNEESAGESYLPKQYLSAASSGLELVVPADAGSLQWNAELKGSAK